LAGQRIGILGANGQGKSTLVKTIARSIKALSGELTEGKGLNIGYFAQQELDVLHPADNPLEHMIRLVKELGPTPGQSGREQDLRNFLGTFNFTGDMVKQSVGSMSGGEKARLVLAMIVWQRPNLLLLDEPTNHLDLATREALSMALNEFEGTVMLVSHDRALLRAVCDEFWLVGRGEIKPFDGDLDDYQRYLLEESKRLREEAKASDSQKDSQIQTIFPSSPAIEVLAKPLAPVNNTSKQVNRTPEQKKEDALQRQQKSALKKPLKKSIEQADQKMAQLEAQKLSLENKLASPLSPTEIAETGKQLKSVNVALEELEAQWLSWSEALEKLDLETGSA
jgi:ATP-binding cassette subfamily F protein 3